MWVTAAPLLLVLPLARNVLDVDDLPGLTPPSAHEEPVDRSSAPSPEASVTKEEAPRPEGEHEEEEPTWSTNIDVVIGAGTTDVLSGGPPGPRDVAPTNVYDSTRVRATSLMLGLDRHLGERFEVGARIPFVFGSLSSRTNYVTSRDELLLGNLELEGVFVAVEGRAFELDAGLEVALPTGGGTEQPPASEVASNKEKRFEYAAIDRAALAKVAEWSRGSYDSALFEPGRLGLVPHASAQLKLGRVTIRSAIKVANLVDVTGNAAESYIGELVAGVRVLVRVAEVVEPGVHVWTNITYTKHEERDLDVGLVSPLVRFPLGNVTPEVSVVLPFFGRLVDDKAFGVRAGLTAMF